MTIRKPLTGPWGGGGEGVTMTVAKYIFATYLNGPQLAIGLLQLIAYIIAYV